jgi:hypothetical protein
MDNRLTDYPANTPRFGLWPPQFLEFGKVQTDAMLRVQRELLHAYAEAGRAWTARMKSEVEFWAGSAARLAACRTFLEGATAYNRCVSQRLQMFAEDGRQVFQAGQKFIATVTRPGPNSDCGGKSGLAERRVPQDWARLIRKMHWIGLEDEAKSLEKAVRTLPPEERGIGSCETFDTD